VHVDILVFAVIAAFLIFRLNALLGTRNGGERPRPNPFADNKTAQPVRAGKELGAIAPPAPRAMSAPRLSAPPSAEMIDAAANAEGRVEEGLADIAKADAAFDAGGFLQGARHAFEMIVEAFARGDLDVIRPLVSQKLFADFAAGVAAREKDGRRSEVTIHRILSSRVTRAHLGGVMAYVTVAFDVEETSVTRDAAGVAVEGDPDRIFQISDVWTFARDTRSHDPNWTLIETKSVEK
jgi:predicted lipid-binding transport protein (Tim44 family)